MRRILPVLLALACLGIAAPAATAATAAPVGVRWAATPNVMAWGRTLEWGGFQVSGDFIYGHNPGGGDYATKGAWSSGTVLEARGYFVERSGGDVYPVTRWRTRRGTTAIKSDWNTGGTNSSTESSILSYTTGYTYSFRDDYPDYLGTSAVYLPGYPDCSQVAGTDRYQGATLAVTANPAGSTDGVSGSHDQATDFEDNNILDCGEQA